MNAVRRAGILAPAALEPTAPRAARGCDATQTGLSSVAERRACMIHVALGVLCALVTLCTVGAIGALSAESVQANYPRKPIRFIIANTTGTSVDTLARIVGAKMSELLGQQMVADNRGGAGGLIGAEIAAHA